MKLLKLVVAASLVTALGACHKSGGDPASARGIENSSGSFAPDANNVPGTGSASTGVGSTGVPVEDIGKAPTLDTTTPNAEALEPTAPAMSR